VYLGPQRLSMSSVLLPVAVALGLWPLSAWSHGFAGKRFFPTTFKVDDPFVSDELSLLYNRSQEPADADLSGDYVTEISGELAKRITPQFGLFVGGSHLHRDPREDKSTSGFGNLEVGAKYQFLTSDRHEAIMSAGLAAEVGGTGSSSAGVESFSVLSPTFYFGKGFGDLPDSWAGLRPLAVTGVLSVDFPTEAETVTIRTDTASGETEREAERNPTTFSWGFSFQYSLPYLQSFVRDVGLEPPFSRMIPLVEVDLSTCLDRGCGGETTGTVNPGVVWFGKYMELGVAAQVPIDRRSGGDVGVLVLVHVFLDDVFPHSLGRPLFGDLRR
jgi:hypothetical protein